MQPIPVRHTLADQAAAVLREGIADGRWHDWLPSERALCDQLQISRITLRTALEQLRREQIVRPWHGAGHQILVPAGRRPSAAQSRDVGLLAPAPLPSLRPNQTIWIDELRGMLGERECRLHIFHGRQYFQTDPDTALQRLVSEHRHGCWVLTLSTPAIQRWFARSAVPCVVAGTVGTDVNLPSRDHDQRAISRHAAGMLLRHGHRQLALVIAQSDRQGDLESEAGFVEGVRTSPHRDVDAVVCRHDGTVPGIRTALRRLLARSSPPTGLLAANAFHCLAIVGLLAQMGRRVPEDISVISRDDEAFMSFEVPTPTRYEANPRAFAKSLLEVVLELLQGQRVARPSLRIMPRFIRGETLTSRP